MNAKRFPSRPVLIVDDDANVLVSLSTVLKAEGMTNLLTLRDPTAALRTIEENGVGIVLLDLTMPVLRGDELLPRIRQEHPVAFVVIVTGNAELDSAIACMKAGARDYLVKPVERARLVSSVRRMIEEQQLIAENQELKRRYFVSELERPEVFASVITVNERMKTAMLYAEAVSRTSNPVFITGETGVGKELFARAIHDASGCKGAFVPVNIAGLDDELFSDLLFGHRAGSYTGATVNREGLIEKARVVAATNKEIGKAVEDGEFRKDLFYRLHIHHLIIPPLRERLEDIPALAAHFIEQAAREAWRPAPEISLEALAFLQSYGYPGNVRELRSLIFDAVSSDRSGILARKRFERSIVGAPGRITQVATQIAFTAVLPSVKRIGDLLVVEAPRRAKGNQTLAARMIGITPQAISKRLKKD